MEQALQLDPDFCRQCDIADHYLDPNSNGRANYGRAAKWLEAAFIHQPNIELLQRLQKAWKANDGQFISQLKKSLGKVKAEWRAEALRVVATAAEQAGLEGEATRFRHEVVALADKVAGNNGAGAWPADNVATTWQCDVCKSVHDIWHSHCQACAGNLPACMATTAKGHHLAGLTPLARSWERPNAFSGCYESQVLLKRGRPKCG